MAKYYVINLRIEEVITTGGEVTRHLKDSERLPNKNVSELLHLVTRDDDLTRLVKMVTKHVNLVVPENDVSRPKEDENG